MKAPRHGGLLLLAAFSELVLAALVCPACTLSGSRLAGRPFGIAPARVVAAISLWPTEEALDHVLDALARRRHGVVKRGDTRLHRGHDALLDHVEHKGAKC